MKVSNILRLSKYFQHVKSKSKVMKFYQSRLSLLITGTGLIKLTNRVVRGSSFVFVYNCPKRNGDIVN
jgi:hypothetical protein